MKSGERGLHPYPPAAMISSKRGQHPQFRQWLRILMGTFLICMSLALGSLGGVLSQTIRIGGSGSERTIRVYNPQTGAYEDVRSTSAALNPLDMLSFSTLDRKINILLLGSDYNYVRGKRVSDEQAGMRSRTDTIMLASLDPSTGKVNIMSIPRDTRALLPGHHIDKINAAMPYGGVELVKATVSELTGVPIDYYMALKVDGLVNTVDLLGGIRIYVEKDMKYQDDTAHLGINIHKGWKENMNGEQAHQYVRFRKDELGDIGRVQRQQKFINAVLDKLLQPQSLVKVPMLLQHLNENIETDLPSDVIGQIFRFGTSLKKSNLNMTMLPGTFANISGISYWQMDPYLARNVISSLFPESSLASTPDPYETGSSDPNQNPYAKYRVVVWNATDDRRVGKEVIRRLQAAGWRVTNVAKAPHAAPTTRYIAQTGKSDLLAALQSAVGFPRGEAFTASIGDIASDFTVLICEDLAIYLRNTMTKEDWAVTDRAPFINPPVPAFRPAAIPASPLAQTQPLVSARPSQIPIQQQTPAYSQAQSSSPASVYSAPATRRSNHLLQSSNQPIPVPTAVQEPIFNEQSELKPELQHIGNQQGTPDSTSTNASGTP